MPDTPLTARVALDNERTIGAISPFLFGGFAEHMGRCVYGGLYDPDSPLADKDGFRRDVMEALRAIRLSILRYPGGNMLSGYDWRDGVGPRESRPRRRELAWQSIETNQFGTDEFIAYCQALQIEPMLGVNLGTGTIADAAALVEYCNAPAGTAHADLRVANGHAEPHGVRYWCLGNEMDGPWQMGGMAADEYARKALEAAKMMRYQDSDLKLIVCGSSNARMPTYPEWDRIVLETCWEQVDYLALHEYATNHTDDTASYLALGVEFEDYLDTVAGLLRFVKAKRRSKHDVYLSWDEWNVWYKDRSGRGGWQVAPPLSEEVYNLEDALVVGQWLNVFLRHCDVLQIACLAQVVNTISPLTVRGDQLLRHTTYYPIELVAQHASGQSLAPVVTAPEGETARFGSVPLLDAAASYDAASGQGAVFLVNRDQREVITTTIAWRGDAPSRATAIYQLAGTDPKAVNTFERPGEIVSRSLGGQPVRDGALTLALPPLSFTAVITDDYGASGHAEESCTSPG